MKNKKILLALFAITFMMLLVACGGSDDEGSSGETDTEKTEDTNTETEEGNEEESSGEQVLKIANDQEPAGLDPTYYTSTFIRSCLFKNLQYVSAFR